MSLDVPTALIEKAEHGEVADVEFVACVKSSLPYAWTVVALLISASDAIVTKAYGPVFAWASSVGP